ncbi:MAG: hypothetical protein HOQ24_13440 [Mycobacteriaceae bacterium]|nr:hypothetical protein [Mycobacteriaceae bacterium]
MTANRSFGPVKDRLTSLAPIIRKNPKSAVMAAGAAVLVAALPVGIATGSHGTGEAASTSWHAAAITKAQLEPVGVQGEQSFAPMDADQWQNAKTIVNVVKERKMDPYAAVISVATALQESKLQNLNIAVDYDSLGLFQQRPSCGWGTPDQLVNPKYATNAFLDAMVKAVPNYKSSQLWEAAQTTQQSAFPMAYAQWQNQATHIVQQVLGGKA